MERTYEVINIYRNYEAVLSFTVALFGGELEYCRVDRTLSARISQGLVFIGDFVRVTARTPDGILFAVVQDPGEGGGSQLLSDGRYNESRAREEHSLLCAEQPDKNARPQNYLPFLCDVLPYFKTAVEAAQAVPVYREKVFQGRYSVNGVEITNIKIPLPPQFVAKIHQKTRINMYPTTYNPFFFIIVASNNVFLKIVFWRESLRKYSSLNVGDIIHMKEYKNKKKLPFIDKIEYNTFTESVYFDCDEITARELIKINVNKRGTIQHRFETVEGTVSYASVLLRYTGNSSIMEYLLCRIGGKGVVLFYNSDDEFSGIRDGVRIRITELRKTARAGWEFYISTIYTQFEIVEETEAGGVQAVHLEPEEKENGPAKRALDAAPEPAKKQAQDRIFGAVGFVPDYFVSTSEILEHDSKEIVQGQDVSVNLFMKPSISTLEEIEKVVLILNESKKHLVHSLLVSLDDDDLSIDYTENGRVKKQIARKVTLESHFECYLFDNFFTGEACACDLRSFVGQNAFFVIESFRADLDTVLHYVTGVMEK